jgi:hypothetical protein
MGGDTLADALGAACYQYDRGLLCHVFGLLLKTGTELSSPAAL